MAWAVTLRTDASTGRHVSALGDRLADTGISRSMRDLGYDAHVTLAICQEMDVEAVSEALAALSRDTAAIPLSCAGFGIFPGPPCCLWLAPVVTSQLLALHARLAAILSTTALHPHYAVGSWIPHLTLAKDLADTAAAAEAIRHLGQAALPASGLLDRIEIVRFRPVEIIWSAALAEPAAETAPAQRVESAGGPQNAETTAH